MTGPLLRPLLGPHGVHLADLVLLALAAEAVLLLAHPRLRRTLPPHVWAPTLLAGAFLALALRLALSGASPLLVALSLAPSLPAQLLDLRRRASPPRTDR